MIDRPEIPKPLPPLARAMRDAETEAHIHELETSRARARIGHVFFFCAGFLLGGATTSLCWWLA